MTETKQELKLNPCLRCHSTDVDTGCDHSDSAECIFIVCNNCGIRTDTFRSEEAAAADWNKYSGVTRESKTKNMNFLEMLRYLREHKDCKARRPGWNNGYVIFLCANVLQLRTDTDRVIDFDYAYEDYDDIFAEDWEIMVKPLTYIEAIQHAMRGKKIARLSWPPTRYVCFDDEGVAEKARNTYLLKCDERETMCSVYTTQYADVEATDWYVKEE